MQSCSRSPFNSMNIVSLREEEMSPEHIDISCSFSRVSDGTETNSDSIVMHSTFSRDPLSVEFLSLLCNLEKETTSTPEEMTIPTINTAILRQSKSDSAEYNSDAADCSTGTSSSHSPAAVNPRRSMNPAFSISPRTASSSGRLCAASMTSCVTIHMDGKAPPTETNYALGTIEGRRNFLADCLYVARHMSNCKIVEDLIPAMLIASNYDDSLCNIARVLPNVIMRIQDLTESMFAYFLGLIMKLCCAPDHGVIRQISASLKRLVLYVNIDIAEHMLLPFVMSMRVSFWSSPRAVAAALIGIFASRIDLVKKSNITIRQWFNYFSELTRDKCQFVQESAVKSLHQWITVAKLHQMNFDEIPFSLLYECMTEEKSDVVRHLCVAEIVRLAEGIGKDMTTKYLQVPLIALSKDSSWRVRYIVMKYLGDFCRLCLYPDNLLDIFVTLCADNKKEIRAAAIEQLEAFISYVVSENARCKICVAVTSLAKDKEVVVRMCVAKFLYILLSPSVVHMYTEEQQKNLFALLTDEDYTVGRCATRNLGKVAMNLSKYIKFVTNPNSRIPLNINTTASCGGQRRRCSGRKRGSKKAVGRSSSDQSNTESPPPPSPSSSSSPLSSSLSKEQLLPLSTWCVGEEQRRRAAFVLDKVIDHLHIVSNSKNWRIREALVIALRYFSVALTEKKFVPLVHIVRSLLRDGVSAVRARAVETFFTIAVTYGPEWAAFMAFDLLQTEFAVISNTNYLWRVMAIKCLSGVLSVVCGLSPMDLRRQELLEQWVRLVKCFSEDTVSNVRLVLVRSMVERWELYTACGVKLDVICMCIKRLQQDSDVDVSRVAQRLDISNLKDREMKLI